MNATPPRAPTSPTAQPKAAWRLPPPLRSKIGRAFVAAILIGVALAAGAAALWSSLGDAILADRRYRLDPHNIEITPSPPWIRGDLCQEVIRDASLDQDLSILDPDLTERIAKAFMLHPWVDRVVRVSKHHPARVRVELVYRRPVCMVKVRGGVLPVDASGIVLPSSDFSPLEARTYPRLVGIQSAPIGPAGTHWGDALVTGGAEIAAALAGRWQRFQLDRIEPVEVGHGTLADTCKYELVTRSGRRIAWGAAPSAAASHELSAAEKVARMESLIRAHGSLDDAPQPVILSSLYPTTTERRDDAKTR